MRKFLKNFWEFAFDYHFSTARARAKFTVQDSKVLEGLLMMIVNGVAKQKHIRMANKLSKKESDYKRNEILEHI